MMTPHPFPYLAKLATKYGKDEVQIKQFQDGIIEKLSRAQLAELSKVYNHIIECGQSERLWRWIKDKSDDGHKTERRQAMLLLFLFNGLARHSILPFSKRPITSSKSETYDWSKIPGELQYLVGPASKYGIIQSDDDVSSFCRSVSNVQLKELQEVSKAVAEGEDNVEAFLDRFPITEHPEACCVYFLIGLIDALKCCNKLS